MLRLIQTGTHLADILCAAPNQIERLYPLCYLRGKPDDCARVMSLICLHGEFDDSAPLPCVTGDVNWVLSVKPLTNAWLNQLMQSLDELDTPRARLTQAYLLIHYAEQNNLTQPQTHKCCQKALGLLVGLHHSSTSLQKITKFLLLNLKNLIHIFMELDARADMQVIIDHIEIVEGYIGRFDQHFSHAAKFNQPCKSSSKEKPTQRNPPSFWCRLQAQSKTPTASTQDPHQCSNANIAEGTKGSGEEGASEFGGGR